MNSAVLTLSQELIDDFPVSDPRWAESIPAGLCVTVNLSLVKRNNLMKNTIGEVHSTNGHLIDSLSVIR